MGVLHRPIATMNPRANGQVERFNRTIKSGLRKMMSACPGTNWWDVLYDVARAIRLIPAAATGFSPHILVYKQSPQIAFPAALGELNVDDLSALTES